MSAIVTAEEVEQKALPLPEKANQIQIVDAETYQHAGEFTLTLRAIKKEIDNTFDPIVKKAHEAHKEAVAQKKKVMEPVDQAQKIVDQKIGAYKTEQDRLERIERERRQKEAEEKARQEAEDLRLREAAELEAEGNSEMANHLLEAPLPAPPIVVQKVESQTPKVDGLSVVKTYKAQVDSFPQLVQAVAQGRAPISLLQPNESALNGMARALKEGFQVQGCKLIVEQNVRGRS